MRKALNEDPKVQMIVLAVCAVAFAVILFTQVLGKGDSGSGSEATPATPTPVESAATPAPTDTAAPTGSATATAPVAPVTPEAATPAPPDGGSVADGLLPSKGLPKEVLVAFAKNQTIALLVIDPKNFADDQLKSYTETLRKRGDVEVFVVDVKDIAKYSRVTAGVSVSRTPALVVIRPRKLTGSVPTATVSYGFRGAQSVNQAVDDALYKGKQIPSYP